MNANRFGVIGLLAAVALLASCSSKEKKWVQVENEPNHWVNEGTGCHFAIASNEPNAPAVILRRMPYYPGRVSTLIIGRRDGVQKELTFVGVSMWKTSSVAQSDSVKTAVKEICSPRILSFLPDSLRRYAQTAWSEVP